MQEDGTRTNNQEKILNNLMEVHSLKTTMKKSDLAVQMGFS